MIYSCFATTIRGLEKLLADELTTLGASEINIVNAGLEFKADFNDVMRMNLHSRLANRIMIRLDFSGYRNEADIYNLVYKIEWNNWFNSGNTIKVSTTAIDSPLQSIDFATLKVKDAICDYFVNKVDSRPSVDKVNPDIRIYSFLTNDSITIYLDTSGDTLFKRGYYPHKLEAPLRENLASALVQLSGWTPEMPFYDPMCGSGTIIAEAVSYGLSLAPGLMRNFAFEKFVYLDKVIWNKLKSDAKALVNYDTKLEIFASDISQTAVDLAKKNLSESNLAKYVQFSVGDFLSKTAPAESGIIVTNPPYGIRMDEQDNLALLYPQIGDHLKKNYPNWNCYIFSGDLRIGKLIGLKPTKRTPLYNGSLECRLFEFKIVNGSNRLKKATV